MSLVFAFQHRSSEAYFLFGWTEEIFFKDASHLILSKVNKFFEACPDIKNYKIGVIDDYHVNIINEVNNKLGEQYEDLKDDEYCMNTNFDSCMEMLNKKVSIAKSKAKKTPITPVEDPTDVTEKAKPKSKPKPKPRAKKNKWNYLILILLILIKKIKSFDIIWFNLSLVVSLLFQIHFYVTYILLV